MATKLIWITPDAEKVMAYCARVSNPSNQNNENTSGLLKYCMKHGHWSVFEMASMCMEITTSRAISAQILRHRSFSFQEFSQRYAESTEFVRYPIRRQDTKNRQNSIDDMDNEDKVWWHLHSNDLQMRGLRLYNEALKRGIAKECARMILPLSTETKLYMAGTIRSWIHYLQLRCSNETQLEHRLIANNIKTKLLEQLPILGEVL